MNYALAFKAFFGISPNNIKTDVIITNITPIFCGVIAHAEVNNSYETGFYKVTEIKLKNGRKYHIIKITSGSNIIDVIKLLTMYVKKIYIIGIAGCLDCSHSIGDVCEPTVFTNEKFDFNYVNNEIVICQTHGLIQSEKFDRELQCKGVTLVDMECYDVFELCRSAHIPFKYIVQISDFPLIVPFYSLIPQQIKIEQILNLIEHDK